MVWNFGGSDILIPVRKELVEWNEADTESFGVHALACADWAHPKGWTQNRPHPFFTASGCLSLDSVFEKNDALESHQQSGLGVMPFGSSKAESQRDSVPKPRVAPRSRR